MFLSLFNVSVTTVTSLNPWIGSDCDTGVWDALSSDGFEQICVEGNSSAVPTSTISTILEPTSTIATTATPPEEVMPDEASTCNKWHTVMSGDDYQAPLLIGMTSCWATSMHGTRALEPVAHHCGLDALSAWEFHTNMCTLALSVASFLSERTRVSGSLNPQI